MLNDRFSGLIEELSSAIKIPLKPDKNNACLIQYPDGMKLYLQASSTQDIFYLAAEIANPGSGKYRENIFKEALKANGLPPPRIGIFCYSPVKDALLLYDSYSYTDVNGERLSELMSSILEKAKLWKESINRGEIPSYRSNELTFGKSKSGMLGL